VIEELKPLFLPSTHEGRKFPLAGISIPSSGGFKMK
jgi:hypothetical protein